MQQFDVFTVNNLEAKFKVKYELINVLFRENYVSLPPKREVTQKYLRDLLKEKNFTSDQRI